ncbi:MAG: hypothetical protein LDL24_03785 [Treponema sp.]|nr:hypothetical protein [Treponema sp.]
MKDSSSVRRIIRICVVLFLLAVPLLSAETLYSPTWGFSISPPEGYTYKGGDGKNRFSFSFEPRAPAYLDIRIYDGGTFDSVDALALDIQKRLSSQGEREPFVYRSRKALLMELSFILNGKQQSGWGLCIELDSRNGTKRPLMAALAYGDKAIQELLNFHLSALDSIIPGTEDSLAPGPISIYAFPEGDKKDTKIAIIPAKAKLDPNAALACKTTVDREFAVLSAYQNDSLWKDAWIRFYRMLFRDSYDRLADVAFAIERNISQQIDGQNMDRAKKDRYFAEQALAWVQQFSYERDLMGTDFVDLVTAATEGRGDCDSRAMLWAIILQHNNIKSAIMVSRDYSHAMGLALLEGSGARFTTGTGGTEQKWLVAETTAQVPLGLIGASVADPAKWIPVLF